MRPSRMRTSVSVIAAASRLWVAIKIAVCVSPAMRRSRDKTMSALALSRLPIGSSANSSFGE